MSEYWANFIKAGNPNRQGLTEFPATSTNATQVMWLRDSTGASYLTTTTAKFDFTQAFSEQMEI